MLDDRMRRVFWRLLEWRMDARSEGRWRVFQDEFGFWMAADRYRFGYCSKDRDNVYRWIATADEQ